MGHATLLHDFVNSANGREKLSPDVAALSRAAHVSSRQPAKLNIISEASSFDPGALSFHPVASSSEPDALRCDPDALGIDTDALSGDPEAPSCDPGALRIDPEALSFDPDALSFDVSGQGHDLNKLVCSNLQIICPKQGKSTVLTVPNLNN
jgi:hypothetical protein